MIVAASGYFDPIHVGHLEYLKMAKELGDFLIVGTVSDLPVRELKGDSRPIQSQEDRRSHWIRSHICTR